MANAADRKSIRAQEKAGLIADRSRREVIGQIMSTAPGRAWLWDTLSTCSIFITTHNPDPYIASFNEGRRSVGLALLADIMAHCPDQYIEAMREANVRHISHDRSTSVDPATADPLAERPSGEITDGGDTGAESDSYEAGGEGWRSPGSDIYVDSPRTKAS
jgi:hypothetical protein